MSVCPKCQRDFPGESFCPHDGSALTFSDDKPTILEDPSRPSLAGDSSSIENSDGATLLHSPVEVGTDHLPTQSEIASAPTKPNPEGTPVSRILKKLVEDRPEHMLGLELEGRYKIERQIGEGGMGVVYLARHSVIEKLVAVKVLRAEVATSDSVVKRFVQEARAASRIGHPNIIDVTDFGTTASGLTYQVMEYLQGKTLARLLKDSGTLSVTRSLLITTQVARALQAAHEKGIVHRDLKPENIFLIHRNDSEDFVKIVDFGIAKVVSESGDGERLTRVGTVIGTPQYMAPEQAAGRADVDARADIYALGIILYEMLSGKVPLEGETTVRTLAMQILDEPERLLDASSATEVTEELSAVVMTALIKKPSKRFQTMLQFLNALEKATNFTQIDLPIVQTETPQSPGENRFDTIPDTDGRDGVPVEVSAQKLAAQAAEFDRVQPSTRVKRATDPLFTQDKSTSISVLLPDVASPSTLPETRVPSTSGSSLLIIGITLFVVAAAVVVYGVTRKNASITTAHVAVHDAGHAIFDGATDVVEERPIGITLDAGSRPNQRDANPESDLMPQLEVLVVTRPRNARIVGNGRRVLGTGEVLIRRKSGASLTIKCQKEGYLDGTVTLLFNGAKGQYTCRLKKLRRPRCVEGMMNPFDDCPK